MKKVIITGGRDFNNASLVFDVLERIDADVIIHGDCSGADTLAAKYGKFKGLTVLNYPAKWSVHGKAAGPIRNREMIELHPDAILIAFPGGRGTEDCIKQALAHKMTVLQVRS